MPTIELYAQARLLAGRREVAVTGATLGEALRQLAAAHPALVGTVLEADGELTPAFTANVNGRRFSRDPDEPLDGSDEVLIISSLSGG